MSQAQIYYEGTSEYLPQEEERLSAYDSGDEEPSVSSKRRSSRRTRGTAAEAPPTTAARRSTRNVPGEEPPRRSTRTAPSTAIRQTRASTATATTPAPISEAGTSQPVRVTRGVAREIERKAAAPLSCSQFSPDTVFRIANDATLFHQVAERLKEFYDLQNETEEAKTASEAAQARFLRVETRNKARQADLETEINDIVTPSIATFPETIHDLIIYIGQYFQCSSEAPNIRDASVRRLIQVASSDPEARVILRSIFPNADSTGPLRFDSIYFNNYVAEGTYTYV